MLDRNEGIALAKRALAHQESRTTDQAPDVMRVPVSAYTDPDVFKSEMDTIFRRVPLALALSVEIPDGGDYKSMEVLGIPVLLIRGHDGVARAFLNACRHRGARICDPGTGNRRRFRCPYHAWVYDDHGKLLAVFREETFGEVDRATHSLRELPAAERAGIVWVCLTVGAALDLDGWLGDFGAELDRLQLGGWHLYERRELPGPGWKVVFDGYLEGYHLQALHRTTFGVNTIGNLMVADDYGPHQRVTFATKSLPRLRETAEDDWDPAQHCAPIYVAFPNLSIAGTWQDHCSVSQIFPGPTVDTSTTVQTILTRNPIRTDEERRAAEAFSDLIERGIRDEDYKTGFGVQAGLRSEANTHFVFGRNEIAVQHLHRWIDRLMGRT